MGDWVSAYLPMTGASKLTTWYTDYVTQKQLQSNSLPQNHVTSSYTKSDSMPHGFFPTKVVPYVSSNDSLQKRANRLMANVQGLI